VIDPREAALRLRREFDASFARAPAVEREVRADYLAIRAGGDPYAVRVAEIAGVHADRTVVPVPSAVPALLGLLGLRGAIAPVYDLPALLGYAQGARRWLILAGTPAAAFAFDAVEAHVHLAAADLLPDQDVGPRRHVAGAVRAAGVVRPLLSIASLLAAVRGEAR